MKNGVELKRNSDSHILKIDSVKKDDRGMYQCFIRNDQESAQATAELRLGGRFDPPEFINTFTGVSTLAFIQKPTQIIHT